MTHRRPPARTATAVAAAVVAASVIGTCGVPVAAADPASAAATARRDPSSPDTSSGDQAGTCPALHLVFVNGTLDSNPNSDPNTDQGFFAHVFDRINHQANEGLIRDRSGGLASEISSASASESAAAVPVTSSPVTQTSTAEPTADPTSDPTSTESSASASSGPGSELGSGSGARTPRVSRSYVNYPATAGGAFFPGLPQANPGDTTSYVDSMNIGVDRAVAQIRQVAHRCPDTAIGLMGYSQGGEVISNVTKMIGAGRGPIPADRLVLSSLFATPTRKAATPTQVDGHDSVGSGDVKEATEGLSAYPTPDGGGISQDKTGIDGYGAVSDRTVSWCLNGDVVCGLPVDSTTARALVGMAEDADLTDPVGTLGRLADGLGQAMAVSDVNRVSASDVDFGPGGFTLDDSSSTASLTSSGSAQEVTSTPASASSSASSSHAPSSGRPGSRTGSGGSAAGDPLGDAGAMIGRFISSAKSTSAQLDHPGGSAGSSGSASGGLPGLSGRGGAGDAIGLAGDAIGDTISGVEKGVGGQGNVAAGTTIEDRLVPAMADLGGMALGAAVTTAKKTLSPANLAAIGAAGATGGVSAAGAVAMAKFSEAGLDLIKPENASVFTRKAMSSLQQAGLGAADVAKLAVELSRWKSMNEHLGYDARPVMADGRTAVDASVDWAVAAAEDAGWFTAKDLTAGSRRDRRSGALGESAARSDFDTEAAGRALSGISVHTSAASTLTSTTASATSASAAGVSGTSSHSAAEATAQTAEPSEQTSTIGGDR